MSRIVAEKSYYEIQTFLGEGLTSEVYKAFRVDGSRYTKQPVALKIVKSKNHIQVLRKEFEKLQKVDSLNCVKLYGWENLKQGPALVLELLHGITLDELSSFAKLDISLIDEIIFQVQNGLRDIHKSGLVHGDLNFKNIFITSKGVIKLLDFGVLHNVNDFFGTPQFVAPEVWESEPYNKNSDLFSLGLVRENLFLSKDKIKAVTNWQKYLLPHYEKNSLLLKNHEERTFLNLQRKIGEKEELKNKVNDCLLSRLNEQKTVVLKKNTAKKVSVAKPFLILLSAIFMSFVPFINEVPKMSSLEVRANKWMSVSINGLPSRYVPLAQKSLRSGKYKLIWGNKNKLKEKQVQLLPNKTFILKPGVINL